MEQNKITPMPWRSINVAQDRSGPGVKGSDGSLVASVYDEHDTSAIVSAVNNTYGTGINPEAVKPLFDALQVLIARYSEILIGENSDNPDENPAIIDAKAAIEKAKL